MDESTHGYQSKDDGGIVEKGWENVKLKLRRFELSRRVHLLRTAKKLSEGVAKKAGRKF
jgi:hypothetical protein